MQPSADQASEIHCGATSFDELLPAVTISGFNSVTPSLPSRSQILIVEPVATHSQYLVFEVREKGFERLVVVIAGVRTDNLVHTRGLRSVRFGLPVWREAQCVDNFLMIQRVQVLALVQVPQHRFGVLTT